MQKYKSNSEEETKKIAEGLAKHLRSNVFALTGELGAGKTMFVQGFAKGLGIKEKIVSPTFVLIRQHKIPASPVFDVASPTQPASTLGKRGEPDSPKTLYHIDLYRIDQIDQLGLEEIWSDPDNIVLIEWAEKIKELPKRTIKISIQKENQCIRKISILNP